MYEAFTHAFPVLVAAYDSGWYHAVNMKDIQTYLETFLISKGR